MNTLIITRGQMDWPHVPIALTVIMLAMLLSTPLPIKADINFAERFSPNPVKKGSVDSNNMFTEIPVISNIELGSMRGGFRIGDLDINIGAIVQTFIDGRLALHSQLSVTDNGSFENTITSPASSEIPGATVISTGGNGLTLQEVTPNGVVVDGLEGSEGIIVNDSRGFTAALQSIRKDRFLTTIVNRASGRRIRHEVDVDVTIRNFSQLQRNARSARLTQWITHR